MSGWVARERWQFIAQFARRYIQSTWWSVILWLSDRLSQRVKIEHVTTHKLWKVSCLKRTHARTKAMLTNSIFQASGRKIVTYNTMERAPEEILHLCFRFILFYVDAHSCAWYPWFYCTKTTWCYPNIHENSRSNHMVIYIYAAKARGEDGRREDKMQEKIAHLSYMKLTYIVLQFSLSLMARILIRKS